MNFTTLQNKLKLADIQSLSKELGYARDKNFSRAIPYIINAKSLDEFLYHGYFDWLYGGSRDMLYKLCEHFGLDISDELKEAEIYNDEKHKFQGSYIYADIKPKYRLWASPVPNINLFYHTELYFKSLDEQLDIIAELIKNHYETYKEKIQNRYKIVSYNVSFLGEYYKFDTEANLITKDQKIDKNLQKRKDQLDELIMIILIRAERVVSKECYKNLENMLKDSKYEKF